MKVVFSNLPHGCDFHCFARLPSFPIPLTFKFRDYLEAPPRKSQFHIFHMSVKMYVYLNMWALIHLLWLFMSSEAVIVRMTNLKTVAVPFLVRDPV